MATVFLNGLVKDYNPPGGIDSYGIGGSALHLDPTAQNWAAGVGFACPEGWASPSFATIANVRTLNIPPDTAVPGGGTYKGVWASGANGYTTYDQLDDPTDGLRYICSVTSPNTGLQPHSNLNQWRRNDRLGFAVRSRDAGFYGSVQRVGDPTRWFSTELKALAASGSVQPTYTDKVIDGGLLWNTMGPNKGTWTVNTAYTQNDCIVADGSIMQALTSGTSDPTNSPDWAGSLPNYRSGSLADGGLFWARQAVNAGSWTALTTYGCRVVNGNQRLAPDAVLHSGGSYLIWGGCTGTVATTGGSEPAWATASSSLKFWADGNLIWRFQTFAVSGDGFVQNERLVLTGLKAAASNGKQITIVNDATGGTARDIVLADKDCLATDGIASLTGTDMASPNQFSFGGLSIRIAEGQSVTVQYSTGTGLWTLVAATKLTLAGKAGTGLTPVMRKAGPGYTEVSGHTGGTATPISNHSGVSGYTEVSEH